LSRAEQARRARAAAEQRASQSPAALRDDRTPAASPPRAPSSHGKRVAASATPAGTPPGGGAQAREESHAGSAPRVSPSTRSGPSKSQRKHKFREATGTTEGPDRLRIITPGLGVGSPVEHVVVGPPEVEVRAPRNVRSGPSPSFKSPYRPLSRDERSEFLRLVSEGRSASWAAGELGVPRRLFQELLDEDVQFRDAYDRAYAAAADILEDEAWSRSFQGKSRASADRLLSEQLRARRPDRYAERLQVSGPRGGPIQSVSVSVDHAAVLDVLHEAGLVAPGRLSDGS